MSYSIICDSRYGKEIGISTLALVDRKKSQTLRWTSDNVNLILKINKLIAAENILKKLRKNFSRIVSYEEALKIINEQSSNILSTLASTEELGWDEHKDCI